MAKPIDELVVQIKADTRQLKKELKQVQGKLKTTGAAGGAAFGGMAGAMSKAKVGALAVVGALVAVGGTVKKIAQVGSTFEDLKDSLDTVFGSMEAGNDAMNRIFDFAQKTPFQIETATKAFISLKSAGIEPNNRMLQVFADTASTSVDQLGVFEALVRTVQRSASGGLGLEELNMIMDRGVDVLGILNRELGLSKDEIAKFGATAEGAKLITDALINGLERQFGGAMESKMDNLSTKTSNMSIAFKQLADEVFKSGLGEFLGDMAVSLTDMANAITAASKATRGEGTGVVLTDDPFQNIQKLEKERDELSKLIRSAGLDPNTGENIVEGRTHGVKGLQEVFATRLQLIKNINEELEKQGDLLFDEDIFAHEEKKKDIDTDTLMRQGELKNSATFLANEIKKLKGNTDQLTFANENLEDILEQNKKLFQELGVETIEELEVYLDQLIDGVDTTTDSIENLNNAVEPLVDVLDDELKQAVVNSSNAFTTDFVNALLDGQNGLQSFKDFARSLVSQIIAIFMQLAVVNKIINSIFGLTGSDALATISVGNDGSTAKALDVFTPTSQQISNLGGAGGGAMFSGQPRLVGERGAEIFVPHTNGTLLNNMNSKNAMGGATTVINQSINFATGVVPTVRAEVTKMLPQIAEVTKGAVQESAMRGGSFRRSLVGG